MKKMQILESNGDCAFSNGTETKIRVGAAYQASVPSAPVGHCPNAPPQKEKEGRLVWNPSRLSEEEVEKYLLSIQTMDASSEERALFLLHLCNYNTEEALRRNSFMPGNNIIMAGGAGNLCAWSPYERSCFERGLHKYGKDFLAIQRLIRTKSVQDVVEAYYTLKEAKKRKARLATTNNAGSDSGSSVDETTTTTTQLQQLDCDAQFP